MPKTLSVCKPLKNNPRVFAFCVDLMSVIEEVRPNAKGVMEIEVKDRLGDTIENFVVCKQGEYRNKGLAFSVCPFCAEPIRVMPASLNSSESE